MEHKEEETINNVILLSKFYYEFAPLNEPMLLKRVAMVDPLSDVHSTFDSLDYSQDFKFCDDESHQLNEIFSEIGIICEEFGKYEV